MKGWGLPWDVLGDSNSNFYLCYTTGKQIQHKNL